MLQSKCYFPGTNKWIRGKQRQQWRPRCKQSSVCVSQQSRALHLPRGCCDGGHLETNKSILLLVHSRAPPRGAGILWVFFGLSDLVAPCWSILISCWVSILLSSFTPCKIRLNKLLILQNSGPGSAFPNVVKYLSRNLEDMFCMLQYAARSPNIYTEQGSLPLLALVFVEFVQLW